MTAWTWTLRTIETTIPHRVAYFAPLTWISIPWCLRRRGTFLSQYHFDKADANWLLEWKSQPGQEYRIEILQI